MPGFSINLSHGLGNEGTKERLRDAMSQIQERYSNQISDLEEEWEGDTLMFSFSTFGFRISGTMAVSEEQVHVKGNLPIAAMMFRGKIEQSLKEELGKILS